MKGSHPVVAVYDHGNFGFFFGGKEQSRGKLSKPTQRNQFCALNSAERKLVFFPAVDKTEERRIGVFTKGRNLTRGDFDIGCGGKFGHRRRIKWSGG